jgi:hypothetical protein
VLELALDHFPRPRLLRRRAGSRPELLERVLDGRDGIAQLVGEHGDELVLVALLLAQGLEQLALAGVRFAQRRHQLAVADGHGGSPGEILGHPQVRLVVAAPRVGHHEAHRAAHAPLEMDRHAHPRAEIHPAQHPQVLGVVGEAREHLVAHVRRPARLAGPQNLRRPDRVLGAVGIAIAHRVQEAHLLGIPVRERQALDAALAIAQEDAAPVRERGDRVIGDAAQAFAVVGKPGQLVARARHEARDLRGPHPVVDVGGGAEPLQHLPRGVHARHGADLEPPVCAIVPADADLGPVLDSPRDRFAPRAGRTLPVLGMQGSFRPLVRRPRAGEAGIPVPAVVDVVDAPLRVGGPGDRGNGLGKEAEAAFALAQRLLHARHFGDVDDHVDRADDAAGLVADRARVGEGADPTAVGTLDHDRMAEEVLPLVERAGHPGRLVGQRLAVVGIQAQRAAESLRGIVQRGRAAPEPHCLAVVEGDQPFGIARVRRRGQRLEQPPEVALAVAAPGNQTPGPGTGWIAGFDDFRH